MVDYIPMIVSISIVLIVNLGFWLFYRKRHKKDKGFVFAYYHLSYRRRFKRNLWTIPVIILSIVVVYIVDFLPPLFKHGFLVAASIITVVELVYNYRKAKQEEHNTSE